MKILITKRNSPWGARAKQFIGNLYQHVINFPDPTKKDESVNNHFFDNDVDYKTVFDNIGDTKTINTDDVLVSFTIPKIIYEDGSLGFTKTQQELKNSDTAIMWDGHRYYYYIIKFVGKSASGALQFTGEIDLFFTYANELNFKNQVMIERKHVDRMSADGNFKFDDMYMSENIIGETIPTFRNKKLITDNITKYPPYDTINWLVVYWNNRTNPLVINNKTLPYEVFLYGLSDIDGAKLRLKSTSSATPLPQVNLDKLLSDPKCLAAHILPYFPGDINKIKSIKNDSGGDGLIDTDLGVNVSGSMSITYPFLIPDGYCIQLKNLKTINGYDTLKNDLIENPIINKDKTKLDINKDRNIYLESKLKTGQFTNLEILHPNCNPKSFDWSKTAEAYNLISRLKMYYSFQPDKFDLSILIEEKGEENTYLFDGTHFQSSLEFPIATDKYAEYIANARASSVTGIGVPLAVGAGGTAAAIAAGSLGGPIGALIAGLAGTALGTLGETVKQIDLRLRPDQQKPVNTSIIKNFIREDNQNYFYFSITELWPDQKLTVYDELYKTGYHYQKMENLNNVINTRYYFNYIKAFNTYESLDNNLNLSTRQKELIDTSFREGLTVWHYRDAATWKGILNYEKENLEMVVVNNGTVLDIKEKE